MPASTSPSSDMLDVCKCAAVRLGWPVTIAETTWSRYEGKKLPMAKSAAKQLLPVFPELLDEIARTWRDCHLSSRSHLQPQWTVLSRSCSLPSKSDSFQSALTEKAHKAAALWPERSTFSHFSPRTKQSGARILGEVGTQLRGRRY